jgi:phosphoribosyl-ATP pyrophosphohydrolase
MGYHKSKIKRGEFGELSKIREEFEELLDANAQGAKIMILCELSDLVGAIEGYTKKYHPGISLSDLVQMSNLTQSAFLDGSRKPKNES